MLSPSAFAIYRTWCMTQGVQKVIPPRPGGVFPKKIIDSCKSSL